MILYTVIPQELLFPLDESEYQKQLYVSYQGIPLLVEKTHEDEYKIIRLVSSNPSHYLISRIEPGMTIPMSEIIK
ncbi:YlzJ-like family protein [Bacillus sp. 03113]|uniref:YlzJ-like family protein n=1 Tax=Bacillus sp. 03113 TaxID=2578211 RepID=UPI00114262F4|nr:YlzJ-like family protein [Bacillus sp. 03113]